MTGFNAPLCTNVKRSNGGQRATAVYVRRGVTVCAHLSHSINVDGSPVLTSFVVAVLISLDGVVADAEVFSTSDLMLFNDDHLPDVDDRVNQDVVYAVVKDVTKFVTGL